MSQAATQNPAMSWATTRRTSASASLCQGSRWSPRMSFWRVRTCQLCWVWEVWKSHFRRQGAWGSSGQVCSIGSYLGNDFQSTCGLKRGQCRRSWLSSSPTPEQRHHQIPKKGIREVLTLGREAPIQSPAHPTPAIKRCVVLQRAAASYPQVCTQPWVPSPWLYRSRVTTSNLWCV